MPYKTVGLIGKAAHKGAHASLNALADYLRAKHCTILVEETVAAEMDCDDFTVCDLVTIGKQADLAVVVGGDGNMLGAARVLSDLIFMWSASTAGIWVFLPIFTPTKSFSRWI